MKKRFFHLAVALFCMGQAFADGTKIGDFWYELNSIDKTAMLLPNEDNAEIIDAVIPAKVSVGEVDYAVTSIADDAFNDCSLLETAAIPEGVKSIGDYVFNACYVLKSVTVPDGLKSIGRAAFFNCGNLASITLPESLQTIGELAFCQCESLSSVTIPGGVTALEDDLFSGCEKLKTVTISNGVKSIGSRTFYNCWSLTSITLPESLLSIGESAFCRCHGLSSMTIPGSVQSLGETLFENCDGLRSVILSNGVKSIGASAFLKCGALFAVQIPNSVNAIGKSAFQGCSKLESVVLPKGVAAIEESTFFGCSALLSVTIPQGVTAVGDQAFGGCSALSSIVVKSNNPPALSDVAFSSLLETAKISVPCGKVDDYKNAAGWGNLDREYVEIDANYGITLLANVGLGGTATVAQMPACGASAKAQVVAKPRYGYCFTDWSDGNTDNPRDIELVSDTTLTANFISTMVNYGDVWYELDYDALTANVVFEQSKWQYEMTEAVIASSVPYKGKDYKVMNIDTLAFSESESVKEVVIPEGVSAIRTMAFGVCYGLESVSIPGSMKTIEESAFSSCYALETVTINAKVPPTLGVGTFEYVPSSCKIIVPCGSLDAYLAADGWKDLELVFEEGVCAKSFDAKTSNGILSISDISELQKLLVGNDIVFFGEDVPDEWAALPNVVVNGRAKKILLSSNGGYETFDYPGFEAESVEFRLYPTVKADKDGGWMSVSIPFDGRPDIAPITKSNAAVGKYWAKRFVNATESALVYENLDETLFEANVPYIFAFPGDYYGAQEFQTPCLTITAQNVVMASSKTVKVESDFFDMNTAYGGVAKEAFVLDEVGRMFVYEEGERNLSPFTAYVTKSAGNMYPAPRSLAIIDLDDANKGYTSAPMLPMAAALVVYAEEGDIVVSASVSGKAVICDMNGKAVQTVNYTEGETRVSGLAVGTYVVAGQKVVLTR